MFCGLIILCLHSGWTEKRLLSVDNDDFETIPSSGEESSNSSEEEGLHKNVGDVSKVLPLFSSSTLFDPLTKPDRLVPVLLGGVSLLIQFITFHKHSPIPQPSFSVISSCMCALLQAKDVRLCSSSAAPY